MTKVAVKNSLAILAVASVVAGAAWLRFQRVDHAPDAARTEPKPVETDRAHPKRGSGELAAEPNESAGATYGDLKALPPVSDENTLAKVETGERAVNEPPAEVSLPVVPEPEVKPDGSAAVPPGAKWPRLVDLGSDKCKDCKALAPILDALRQEYKGRLSVEFIDVWKQPNAAKSYKIRLIPTQILYDKDGHELWRHEGFISKPDLKKLFAEKVGMR